MHIVDEGLSGSALRVQSEYWKRTLVGASELITLPTDRPRPQRQDHAGATLEFEFDESLSAGLKALGQRHGATLSMTLLAAWGAVLVRLSGQDEVVVGTPVAMRRRGELEPLIAVNTLALRLDCTGSPSVARWLGRVKALTLGAQQHQDLPFEQVVELMSPVRSLAHSPLFQVMFAWVEQESPAPELSGLQLEPVRRARSFAKFDLTLTLREQGGRIGGEVGYATALFDKASVERHVEYLRCIASAMLTNDTQAVDRLQILPEAERHKLLVQWNDTKVEYPEQSCVHELFEVHAARTPNAVAVRQGDKQLSYGELNIKANQLAHRLIALGVKVGERVAVLLERSVESVLAQLAILKCGAVYVPLDSAMPVRRLAFLIDDSGSRVLVSESVQQAPWATELSRVDVDRPLTGSLLAHNPELIGGGDTAAYVMYTSGSTGRPKGVVTPHRAISRLVLKNGYADFSVDDRFAFAANAAFDASTLEVWGALLNGGQVVVIEQATVLDPKRFARSLLTAGVNVLWLTVGLFNQYADDLTAVLPRLRYLIIGGDVLDARVIARVLRNGRPQHLLNGYGPTESTTFATTFEIASITDERASVPIGRPISNTRVYILDRHGEPVPLGAVGELCIGGFGLALGYLNRPELTAERFVPDPFCDEPGARMYKTGDLARYLPDGNIEFLGRSDFQVKIRGFRIELGEVEARLSACDGVRESIVLAREDTSGEKRLVAYYTAGASNEKSQGRAPAIPDAGALREQLAAQLPEYMVPAAFVVLPALPLTPNGKVDRKALPAPDALAYVREEYEAPVGEIETALARIWCEVLGLDRIGRRDNFFALGGHSLLAIQILTRVKSNLRVDLSIREIFDEVTIADLSQCVTRHVLLHPEAGTAAAAAPPGQTAPLTSLQRGLWFVEQLGRGAPEYNIAHVTRLRGPLDAELLQESLDELVKRHESLRSRIDSTGEVPTQVVLPDAHLPLEMVDLTQLPGSGRGSTLLSRLGEFGAKPLELSLEPLARALLIRLGPQEHVLALVFHHIVFDGWSLAIVLRELAAIYGALRRREAVVLPPLACSWRDVAYWADKRRASGGHEAALGYWVNRLQGLVPLRLPRDPVARAPGDDAAPIVRASVPTDSVRRIAAIARTHSASFFVVLLCAMKLLLMRRYGTEDVAVGVPVLDRASPELESVVGPLLNTIVLRTDIRGDPSFEELIDRVRETVLDGWSNQDAPFDLVVSRAMPQREHGATPYFDVVVNSYGEMTDVPRFDGLESELVIEQFGRAIFPLTLYIQSRPDRIELSMVARRECFSEDGLRVVMEQYVELLRQIGEQPSWPLHAYSLRPRTDRSLLPDPQSTLSAPEFLPVTQRIAQIAQRSPRGIAIRCSEREYEFEELQRKAIALSGVLRLSGVGTGDVVAIGGPKCFGLAAAMIAVLRCGAVILTLDPNLPVARRLANLRATNARLLCLIGPESVAAQDGVQVLRLDAHLDTLPASNGSDFGNPVRIGPDDPAYVFFTSGSSGTPKAVLGRHRGLSHFVEWQRERFGIDEQDRVSQLVSLSFDPMLRDVFLPLTSGACLCIPRDTDMLDPLRWMARERVSVVHTTPTVLQAWLAMVDDAVRLPCLRWLFIAGEPLTDALVATWRSRFGLDAQIVNLYGPTETTLARCHYIVAKEPDRGVQPVGFALPQSQALVVSRHGVLCGIGELGEVVIRTPLRSLGYLNAPEENARHFKPNPWRDDPDDVLYWTGDLGRYRIDGALEVLGRSDDQIKIRGVRIEPGEVMAVLARHPAVRRCVVLPRTLDDGQVTLAAYVEAATGRIADPVALREHLAALLPAAFVPASIVVLDALPTLPNGKIDRQALPAPDAHAFASREYEAPSGEIETALARIWCEVLGVERIGRRDNFFDLGGHSLLAVRVASRVQQRLGVALDLGELFHRPELAALAAAVQNAARSELPLIAPIARDRPLALSFAQQRLWFLSQMDGVSQAYHIARSLRLVGILDRPALRRALDTILARHEALRTTFVAADGEPAQHIAPPDIGFALHYHDLRAQTDARGELRRLSEQEAAAVFDLEAGPLIRGRLIQLGEAEHVLLITMHHIVSDGWSMGVLTDELGALYGAFSQGRSDPLPALQIQYPDFAAWQRRWLSEAVLQTQSEYWQCTLAGAPELLELPTDRPRPQRQDHAGEAIEFEFDEALSAGLRALGQRQGATPFMTLLAAWAALLARLSGQDEVVIGTPVANRRRTELEPLIGFFVNTLALRLDTSGSPDVAQWLDRVKAQALGAQQHQDLPFEQVVELMRPVRSLAHSPLFQVMFAWEGQGPRLPELPGLRVESVSAVETVAKFDLTLTLHEEGGQIAGSIAYATALFNRATIERHIEYLRSIAAAMVADETKAIDRLQILPTAEQHRLLVEWNATSEPGADRQCVHELFEAQAARDPSAIALRQGERQLSYGELNSQANRLAHRLRALGVRRDDRVAVLVERSVEMVVGLLATLKAGGAYVPLDPAYPAQRLAYMLEDSAPKVILTQGSVWAGVRMHPNALQAANLNETPVLDLESEAPRWADEDAGNPAMSEAGSMARLAYVIYTSGSTGQPKGVMVEHRQLANLGDWHRRTFGTSHASCSSALAGIGFDASTWELWSALSAGARLLMPTRDESADPMALLNWWKEQAFDISFLPTPLAELAFAEGIVNPSLKTLLIGGDALRGRLPANLQAQVINNYGPTECAVVATSGRLDPAGMVTHIGRPISNGRAYILDRCGVPTPIGVRGELFIGGTGLARGYLNRPELTAERFIPDPFCDEPGARMYKTGDVARYLPDGNIEFLGRSDFQVKIRGFRIELGEIEARLSACDGVREAIVLAREDTPGDKRLVAYYTVSAGSKQAEQRAGPGMPDANLLREQLAAQLPAYMVPAAFVELHALPLTSNGKVDRRALAAPGAKAFAGDAFEAPVGEIESTLARIWCEVLGLERIGRRDNFFELGGHSLMATQVVSRVRRDLGIAPSVRTVFESPSLQGFAAQLRVQLNDGAGRLPEAAPPLRLTTRDGPLPTSFSQRRMWLVQQLNPKTTAYNIALSVQLSGVLDESAMIGALEAIVQRHEVFRTRFEEVDGEPMQRIVPELGIHLERFDISESEPAESIARACRIVSDIAAKPFDLAIAGPYRIALLRLGPHEHVLLWLMHHAIGDHWSFGILLRELRQAYGALAAGRAFSLAPIALDYADYAAWQREYAANAGTVRQLEYWLHRLEGVRSLSLHTDFPRQGLPDGHGGVLQRDLDPAMITRLAQVSRSKGVTPYMTLLACFHLLMARVSGQHDIAVAAPIANRLAVFSESLVGTLVNTLVMRCDLSGNPTFAEFLAQVRETALQAYANQDVPFEQLVEGLETQRDMLRAPLVQVMFNLVNAPFSAQHFSGLNVETFDFERRTAQFEISVGVDLDVFRQVRLSYASALFAKTSAQRLLDSFMVLVEGVLENPVRRIDEYDMLGEAQRQELVAWNRTDAAQSASRTITELISSTALRMGHQPALRDASATLSHSQLEARSNRLARALRARGISRGALVGLCVERSNAMVIAILAILKAGAAYVPLDPAYPPKRLLMTAQDANLSLLVTQSAHAPALNWPRADSLWLDADAASIEAQDDSALAANDLLDAGPDDPAYVIYTSGSTGMPKGVAVPHRAVLNFLASMAREPGLSADDRVLAVTTLSFDIAVLELLLPLSVGATLILATTEQTQDGRALRACLEEHQASVMQATPSTWRMLLEAGWSGAPGFKAFIGGEGLPLDLAKELLSRVGELWNMYGPTETTVWSTCWRVVKPETGICIGRPIANTQVHVLDEAGRQCLIGVPGEIYIGGDGVALGYLHRPELTAERFVPDPFRAAPGARLYRTGDLGRWRYDGQLEHQGRLDHQVKIRGHRIELGEIEANLGSHSGVARAVVIAREDRPGDARIVAYVVARGAMPAAGELRDHVRAMLPQYMLPQHFVPIESVPLLPNGKLDRSKLPKPGESAEEVKAAPASLDTELERGIAAVWQRLLDIEGVDRGDNFFDLGGHSLLAMRAVSEIEKTLGVNISPRRFIFETLAQLAATAATPGEAETAQSANAKSAPAREGLLAGLKRVFGGKTP